MWGIVGKIFLALNILTLPVNYLPSINLSEKNNQPVINLIQQEFPPEQKIPQKADNDSYGVKITAKSAAVMDQNSGAILWQKNANEIRSLASLTKLMTALVFLEHNPGWQQVMTMGVEDETYGDQPEILRGEQAKIKDIFYTALIASDNNAAQALVNSTGLTEEQFVKLMNAKAASLKLSNTKFVDVTGLAEGNQSTALEVLALAQVAFANSDIQSAVKLAQYDFQAVGGNNHRVYSTNHLLGSYLKITAGKTGFIDASGWNLVVQFNSADKHQLIGVVLGSASQDDRFQDLKALATWILANFSWS